MDSFVASVFVVPLPAATAAVKVPGVCRGGCDICLVGVSDDGFDVGAAVSSLSTMTHRGAGSNPTKI